MSDKISVGPDHWSYGIHCSFQNAYDRLRDSNFLIKPMPVVALFVLDAPEIDAYCKKFDDAYTIMLNSALFDSVNRIFRTILAHPSTFLSIGRYQAETSPSTANKITFDQFINDIPKFADRTPRDKTCLLYTSPSPRDS